MLDKELYYMNPYTGSIAIGQEWLDDFKDSKLTWEKWGGDSLIEVEDDEEDDEEDCDDDTENRKQECRCARGCDDCLMLSR